MIGAMVGDVVGSEWEFVKNKDQSVPLFGPTCEMTDDTVCTAAVALWLHGTRDPKGPENELRSFCRQNLEVGYGAAFLRWVVSNEGPYGSWGNGSAMRVSPCAMASADPVEVARLAELSAMPTHGSSEGIRGAKCAAIAVNAVLRGGGKDAIKSALLDFGYQTLGSLDSIRPTHRFDVSCQGTVPLAMACVLEADSFEGAMRNALGMGGDADTIAAIAGPAAEGLWGVPSWMFARAVSLVPEKSGVLKALMSSYEKGVFGPPRITDAPPEGRVAQVSERVKRIKPKGCS